MIHSFEIRRFTPVGKSAFEELLNTRPKGLFEKLESLAEDDSRTEKLDVKFTWDDRHTTRLDLAIALWSVFGQGNPLEREAGDSQIWNWLSCKLCPILHAGG